MPKVLILDNTFSDYEIEKEIFKEIGALVEVCHAQSETEVSKACHDADGICVNTTPMPASVIKSLANARVIARYGIGYDNVDIRAALKAGIVVANCPDYCTEEVSDQAMALLLSCVRRLSWRGRRIRNGSWGDHRQVPIQRIKGQTVGLVGFGRIGRAMARKLAAFMPERILICDPAVSSEEAAASSVVKTDLTELVRTSDILSLNLPLDDSTRHMISTEEFKAMKDSAVFLNVSRGGLVDQQALYTALKEGQIDSAGIDVFETEPLPPDSPLLDLDNITFSDHVGWYSEQSYIELKATTARNVANVLSGKKALYPIPVNSEQ